MKIRQMLAVTAALILICTASVFAFHDGDHGDGPGDRTFKISKTGEVNFGTAVKIGSQVVKKGKYTLTHSAEGGRHVFGLQEINKKKPAAELSALEFDSRFVPGSERVKNSAVMAHIHNDRTYDVLKIQIAGENGDHIFAANGGSNASTANKN